ncbi:polyprenyl synthetase family protein [Zavarzinia compransoris]|uniref:polyprenyl synthetase family protein n=1 Tax=Zavarzinia marina TaxID=2911065 RepID=UPI001F29084B|nr:polyprenyl synthetase family protein [Zavarzinia marina]MCF4166877.1 polyprenyl synthetase family protein [Zavarzinia marina]
MAVVVSLGDERDKDGRASSAGAGNALETLLKLVADDFAKVDDEIRGRMVSDVPLIPELAGHIIASGGKRLRPVLLLAAARLCGYQGPHHVGLAACVEFIHTATLLHDDVVDESALRRGRATANIVWGNQASVLVGDFLFSRSFQLMTEAGSLAVLSILSEASAIIAEGEVMQLTTANNLATTEDAYLQVIAAKTAALFAAATRVGAVIAGRDAEDETALADYGRYLGIVFQLIDDVLDYQADQATLGKTVGDDFREGKITLPVVLAFARGDEAEKAFWRRCMEQRDQAEGDLATALSLMEKHGTLAETVARARHYGDLACRALERFPDGAHRRAMMGVVDFCIERAY